MSCAQANQAKEISWVALFDFSILNKFAENSQQLKFSDAGPFIVRGPPPRHVCSIFGHDQAGFAWWQCVWALAECKAAWWVCGGAIFWSYQSQSLYRLTQICQHSSDIAVSPSSRVQWLASIVNGSCSQGGHCWKLWQHQCLPSEQCFKARLLTCWGLCDLTALS